MEVAWGRGGWGGGGGRRLEVTGGGASPKQCPNAHLNPWWQAGKANGLLLRSQLYLWGSPFWVRVLHCTCDRFFCLSFVGGGGGEGGCLFVCCCFILFFVVFWFFCFVFFFFGGGGGGVGHPNHRGSHIPSLWMVHAGCVLVAGTHPSRT